MDYSHNFEWYDDNMAVMGVINKISKVINDTEFNEKRLKYSIMCKLNSICCYGCLIVLFQI